MGYTILMPKGIYLHKPENYPPSRKGLKLTLEHKAKISEGLKGNTWNKGRKHSIESSFLKKKNSARYWLGKKRPPISESHKEALRIKNKGHFVSEKTIERMKYLTKGKFREEHPCWVEDKIESFYASIRNHFKYREWRNSVRTKDNSICVLCKKSEGRIDVDHIKRFADILFENKIETLEQALDCTELWDVYNGRVLCYECHKLTDTWGKKRRT
jgi:hypothetical protein